MVITAHPDDAEFACGGTIARWAEEGREVVYVVCTNGDKGSGDPAMTSEKLAKVRIHEQLNAAKTLGVKEVIFLGYPDGELEDTAEFRGKLVLLIRKFRPDIVITMEPHRTGHQHRDHRVAGIVTLDAIFPYARDHLSYPEQLTNGVRPHKVGEAYLAGSENADLCVDIHDKFPQKLAALQCHVSQVGHRPKDEFEKMLREMAARAGSKFNTPLAECFRRIEFRR
jgi:LmbE family N-acetylglucosaminyl deacetylase